MKVPFLDLARQYELFKEELEPRILELLASGQYVMGKQVESFETEVAQYIGVKNAITVANGTEALVIALKALGIGVGDEVITTPFTFFATAESIALVGATPVFVDVLEDTFNIDPSKIEAKITDRTKAIMPVHLFGQPVLMDEISSLAKRYNLFVIEDSCQAIGAKYKDKMVGNLGDISAFSFFPTKNLSCFGDGGLITTNSNDLAILCKAFREHGGGRHGFDGLNIIRGTNEENRLGEGNAQYNPYKYFNYMIAYNSRLDAIQALILRIKLKHLDNWNYKRKEIAKYYNELLINTDVQTPCVYTGVDSVYHQYVVKSKSRDKIIKELADKGIGYGEYYPVPLHLQTAFDYLGYKKGDCPIAELLSTQTFALPIFPELKSEELDYIIKTINNIDL